MDAEEERIEELMWEVDRVLAEEPSREARMAVLAILLARLVAQVRSWEREQCMAAVIRNLRTYAQLFGTAGHG